MVKNNRKNGGIKKKSSNELRQISESPSINQSESNCFFGIKSYIKDFYAQKEESDQESIIDTSKDKNVNRYSSSDSDLESDDDLDRYKNIIKNCDKLKKKSRKKMKKLIKYSRNQFNLFNTNDSDFEKYDKTNKIRSKRHFDEESQKYKSNSKSWSVYVWRSIFIIGCVLLITGLLMAISFLITERQVEIGKQEEMEIIDRSALRFNQILNQLRAFSLALIAVGLLLFVSTLLLPQLIGVSLNCFNFGKKQKDQTFASFFNERSDSDEETGSKIYVKCDNKKGARRSSPLKELEEPLEDNISKIPILEEIQSVQPEREKEESILTSDGFAKLN